MNILFETDTHILQNEYEETLLMLKSSGEVLFELEFYGDPTCGVISEDGKWAAAAGEDLILWKNGHLHMIFGPTWIHELRISEENKLEVLVDPWHEDSAIWEVDIESCSAHKKRDFPDYRALPYTNDIEW